VAHEVRANEAGAAGDEHGARCVLVHLGAGGSVS
jgi:hypothetical protein